MESIALDPIKPNPNPRVVACMNLFEPFQSAGDASCAGWMLMAMRLRLIERNQPG